MFDNSIVNETSPEAIWNRRTGRQANLCVGSLRIQKSSQFFYNSILNRLYWYHLFIYQLLINSLETGNRIIHSSPNRKWNYEYLQILVKNPVSWSLTFIVEWHATNYYHFIISIVSTILIIIIIIIFLILFLLIIYYFNCFNYFNHYNYFDFYNYLNYFHHSIRLINYISNNEFINQTKTLAPLSAGGHFLN